MYPGLDIWKILSSAPHQESKQKILKAYYIIKLKTSHKYLLHIKITLILEMVQPEYI